MENKIKKNVPNVGIINKIILLPSATVFPNASNNIGIVSLN